MQHTEEERGINNEIINIIMNEVIRKYCKGNAYSMYVSKKKINYLLNQKKSLLKLKN